MQNIMGLIRFFINPAITLQSAHDPAVLPVKTAQQQQRRKLSRAHFAFMRALAQGIEPAAAWDRYLNLEGRSADGRVVQSTIAWIRDEFAAAARRQGRPGTARAVRLDPSLLPRGKVLPDLAAFAAARGLEEFSHSEQAQAYAEAYPDSVGAGAARFKRRGRLIERQLQGLAWLEAQVAEEPAPGDPVGAWLAPAIAGRLAAAGIPTLFTLAERINGRGAGWHRGIPGIGAGKAARLVRWVRENARTVGVALGAHVAKPRAALTVHERAAVVPPATALRPLEKFLVPAALDGSAGAFRGPPGRCRLSATTDDEAIACWLASQQAGQAGALSSTQRAYRKEAERLLLWAILEQRKPLSSLTVEDAGAYLAFLRDPPGRWCGARHHPRWSPLWRPLEGPLTASAQGQALTVLRVLFSWLAAQGYLIGNPFVAVAPPRSPPRPLGTGRMLSEALMQRVLARLDRLPETEPNRRLRLALPWLYATGLRLAEMVAARCGHLVWVAYVNAQGDLAGGWLLAVAGQGDKRREVPVPEDLVHKLRQALVDHGQPCDPTDPINAQVPVLARYGRAGRTEALPVAAGGLYKDLKGFFAVCADELEQDDPAGASRLRKASTHWLRHTHASHAVNGRPGRAGVPVQVMQANLGHASLATTSHYLTTERDMRMAAMQGFFNESVTLGKRGGK
jgi:site-specific recombinase XerD